MDERENFQNMYYKCASHCALFHIQLKRISIYIVYIKAQRDLQVHCSYCPLVLSHTS